jgi:transcription elongation GreA/GreB family factor
MSRAAKAVRVNSLDAARRRQVEKVSHDSRRDGALNSALEDSAGRDASSSITQALI